jgi:hypothetical protein
LDVGATDSIRDARTASALRRAVHDRSSCTGKGIQENTASRDKDKVYEQARIDDG